MKTRTSSFCECLAAQCYFPMRKHALIIVTIACTAVVKDTSAQTVAPAAVAPAANPQWQVAQRDFHSETWEAAVPVLDPITGKVRLERHSLVSLASGMNYLDDNQNWQPTREEFEITQDGYAVARFG